ncbi:hypothetical protein LTR37_016763 [Vermiconidia calcicola]|uniref:Uncharacterized protein n=1 Tax=Vermiconidia calcicola TaxID=1690605 RepID=A0ACC3MMU9_9PEZI|nr:hypothetical protein LTR37_016763 [Vermiconidia calcicola]
MASRLSAPSASSTKPSSSVVRTGSFKSVRDATGASKAPRRPLAETTSNAKSSDGKNDSIRKDGNQRDAQKQKTTPVSAPTLGRVRPEQPLDKRATTDDSTAIMSNKPAAPIPGTKRKATEDVPPERSLDDIDCEGMPIDQNCDQVRRKIRRYLDSGAMKVGEFCTAIGVSNNSLNGFLRQSGPTKGSASDAYLGAWEFFKKRELIGMKMPTKKQKTTQAASGTSEPAKEATAPIVADLSTSHRTSRPIF